MQKSLEMLHDRLTSPIGHPALLLGAGFSLGAFNIDQQPLVLGKRLTQELYENILIPRIKEIPDYERDCENVDLTVRQGDLKKFCTWLREFGLENERDEYITRRLKVHGWREDVSFETLAAYPWRYIFTLNMDDLVEKIYEKIGKKLEVWNRDCQNYVENPKETILVKLHGDVNCTVPSGSYRYILDEKEYRNFTASDDRMLQKFGEVYVSNDLIILGTQFQENDLEIALISLLQNKCNNEKIQYFFVSPEISSRSLIREIDKNNNFHHIKMTNIEFLAYMNQLKIKAQSTKKLLLSNSFSDWNSELQDAADSEKTYELYNGADPCAGDFFHEIDIPRSMPQDERKKSFVSIQENFEKNLVEKKTVLVTIHGESFVGKSCLAMRLLTLSAANGYQSFYTKNIDLHIIDKVKEFLRSQTDNSKIAFCMENAALFYSIFDELFDEALGKSVVFITTALDSDHNTKQYTLQNIYDKRLDYYINERISDKEAWDTYTKLASHNRLGRLQSATNKPSSIRKNIRDIGDLIDVLWYAHEGRRFSSYFEGWYKHKRQEEQIEVFEILTYYASLGCEFSISDLPMIALAVNRKNFDYKKFEISFSDFWTSKSKRPRLRYVRLFRDIVVKTIPVSQRIEWLRFLIVFLAKRIKEREQSRNSLMFESVTKIKNISMQKKITNEDILQLFSNVESECQHLSYYWIQRCIIYSKCEKFEDAANSIANAASARKYRTYQIIHAEAKNDMARGIWCIKHDPNHADEFFFRGRDQVVSLIEERNKYRSALTFSVHTYVNMAMKYYNEKKIEPDINEWNQLLEAVSLSVYHLSAKDKIFLKLIEDFVKFAEQNGKRDLAAPFLRELGKKPRIPMDESDYDIDSLPDVEIK
ncbi:hypothetical protein HMPREF9334_01851 [Selenomonas infelix ATCC 43532]|uniref:Uncharacterized protein n=1 Tax=Selenomonas infelix ATCC 43532 TaxID=679201 RepID=G5GRH0_9FIRM|nr:SIR2 family protein [Selenomonas infelix]EHG19536.1 hypothetical protein HMPREF9334_01851 [Selenomonas infelix ATCC 43532]